MAEEFQESDVIFSDDNDLHEEDDDHRSNYSNYSFSYQDHMFMSRQNNDGGGGSRYNKKNKKKIKMNKTASSPSNSLPVDINIPDNLFQYVDTDEFEEDYEDGEITPPHLIVARRIAGKMAFSVCTGNGRTLKGRDLSQVRNSILRMTGFLES